MPINMYKVNHSKKLNHTDFESDLSSIKPKKRSVIHGRLAAINATRMKMVILVFNDIEAFYHMVGVK